MLIGVELFMKAVNNFGEILIDEFVTKIRYGPIINEHPIITVSDDVSSWEIGDEIVIASTDYHQDLTETFIVSD